MKTRNILITLSVAALATANIMASDALLSPRAKDNQIRTGSTSSTDPNLAAMVQHTASPRLLDNQIKTVAGVSTTETPALTCKRLMAGTPKMIGECADHPGAAMPCCSVAAAK